MTRRIAGLEPGDWDGEASELVVDTFDSLAPEWHTRVSAERIAVVEDALSRGLDPLIGSRRLCVEVGSGLGTYTPLLTPRIETVLAVDLSWEMLRRAGDAGHRVHADAGRLPVRDGAVDVIVAINAFLFPSEVKRTLAPSGVLIWVNSSGEETPIHLTTDEVLRSLDLDLEGYQSRAGAGTWAALRRR
ncbi:MAG TPA: class I SAM-dependent methyltransferase [Acidimicrobiia bacterium]|nr:class I SAM-dependent methyltransferase [Acidimicrobiia bacterium]